MHGRMHGEHEMTGVGPWGPVGGYIMWCGVQPGWGRHRVREKCASAAGQGKLEAGCRVQVQCVAGLGLEDAEGYLSM